MKAKAGDWLVMKSFTIDQPEQRGLITEVHSDDGSPPYVVHWLDNGHVATVFPAQTRSSSPRPSSRRPTSARNGGLRRFSPGSRTT